MATYTCGMEIEPAARAILSNLTRGSEGASLGQMRMWLTPEKAENEYNYSINKGYFEMLLRVALKDLISKGYIRSSLPDGMEDGDAQVFSLTDEGTRHVEELARQAEQAASEY
ncbi:MAG TPA: hypothetical protein VF016_11255 [Nitrososphaera sp.]